MKTIHYSDDSKIENPVIQIWDDLHNERAGYYRAYYCASPEATTGSPVVGYCSPGGSFRTIRACAANVRANLPGARIYRNGREVKP